MRTTLSFHITSNKGRLIRELSFNLVDYVAVANGTETSRTVDGDFATSNWRLDYPCPSYLVCFAVGEFISGRLKSIFFS